MQHLVSASLPRWNLLAGIEYDVTNRFSVESFGGVEYENCCWAVRVGTKRYLTINSNEMINNLMNNILFNLV